MSRYCTIIYYLFSVIALDDFDFVCSHQSNLPLSLMVSLYRGRSAQLRSSQTGSQKSETCRLLLLQIVNRTWQLLSAPKAHSPSNGDRTAHCSNLSLVAWMNRILGFLHLPAKAPFPSPLAVPGDLNCSSIVSAFRLVHQCS